MWNLATEMTSINNSNQTSPTNNKAKPDQNSTLLHTFELHKDKGAITNLVSIYRPLSLYGLTANMKAYEPIELKPF